MYTSHRIHHIVGQVCTMLISTRRLAYWSPALSLLETVLEICNCLLIYTTSYILCYVYTDSNV